MEAAALTVALAPPSLHDEVAALREELLAAEEEHAGALAGLGAEARASGRNLIHYLALHRRDRHGLEERLVDAGLASLAGCPSSVLATVEAVLALLARVEHRAPVPATAGVPDRAGARGVLARRTAELLGEGGEEVVRIDCAHGDAAAWRATAAEARSAAAEEGRSCRVLVHLAGGRPRTGAIGVAGQRVKWRPRRDELGRVVEPARLWLVGPASEASPRPALLVADDVLAELRRGDWLFFTDVRGKRRRLRVGAEVDGARACTSLQQAYLFAGESVTLARAAGGPVEAHVLAPREPERRLPLARGERLVLTRSSEPGLPARRVDFEQVQPARISCSPPEIFDAVRAGERIFLDADEGAVAGYVEEAAPDELQVRLVFTPAPLSQLGGGRCLHLPDTQLEPPALTPVDLGDLDVVVELADTLAGAWVRRPDDGALLRRELDRRGGEALGLLLEIDTLEACEALPALLLAALRAPAAGVLLARGGLEPELLALCEAAHLPVVPAQQPSKT